MPSFCHNLSSNYERLRTLTDEFTMQYERVRDSGDLAEVRRLKIGLEEARDALLEQLGIFRVPDAMNPYHEALLVADLDQSETKERQEMVLDIRKEILRQLALYREVTDSTGTPILQEWVDDITKNIGLLSVDIAKDPAKIKARIKAGMIPIVMPSRQVQEQKWRLALTNLKPLMIKNGEKQEIKRTFIDLPDRAGHTSPPIFPITIPDRPYLLWTKPTQEPETRTLSNAIDMQRVYRTQLVRDNPDLYDQMDITPIEYGALQATFTSAVRVQYQTIRDLMTEPVLLHPLDMKFDTLFLTVTTQDNQRICVCFSILDPMIRYMRYGTTTGEDEECEYGFRPASRT